MMKIVVITDGNSKQGLGHIYQSKTLAGYLSEKTEYAPEITFLTKSEDYVAELIRKDGFTVEQLADDEGIFAFLQTVLPQVVIFDKIDVAPLLAKKIKSELDLKLVIFTNLTEANQYADISVMGTMGSNFRNRIDRVGHRLEYWGPKYIVLRPGFFSFQPKSIAEINSILIIFGGADPADLTLGALKVLLKSNLDFRIKVVLGGANKREKEAEKILKGFPDSRVEILSNVSDMANLMYSADLSLVSPGISFFESLAVGTPVISFHQNDLQYNAWKDDVKTYDKAELSSLVHLINQRKFISSDMPMVKTMEIGRGIDDIIKKMTE